MKQGRFIRLFTRDGPRQLPYTPRLKREVKASRLRGVPNGDVSLMITT